MKGSTLSDNYQQIVIDPPWPVKKGGLRSVRPKQGRRLDYDTMSMSDIWALIDTEILPLADPTGHNIWLWEVDKYLISAELEMEKRGYRRHARIIWDKMNGIAPAFTLRYSHEYLVWWYKPTLLPIDKAVRGKYADILQVKSREHSRKPDESYMLIEALYPNSNRIDIFSREKRDGWDQWGNEVDYFAR